MVKRLRIDDAPEVKEISLFRLPKSIDPLEPFRVTVTATRPTDTGTVTLEIPIDYRLPDAYRLAPPAPDLPLVANHLGCKADLQTGIVVAMLAVLTLILFAQEWITRRPALVAYRADRISDNHAVRAGLGAERAAFGGAGCGLPPFLVERLSLGNLSDRTSDLPALGLYRAWPIVLGARGLLRLALPIWRAARADQHRRPGPWRSANRCPASACTNGFGLSNTPPLSASSHLSFYSMHDALDRRRVRALQNRDFAAHDARLALPFVCRCNPVCGLFIERFYCRYLCPLGAGLAIPAKLKVFDWLKRRPQCGRECRLCETKCTVGAIDPLGRINANECVLCLRCQIIMNDRPHLPRPQTPHPNRRGNMTALPTGQGGHPMNRRRFLTITAAALCASPAAADSLAIWKGRALGADAQIAIAGLPENRAALLWPKIEALIEQIEADFSLYRASTLTRLNETGFIANPTRAFQNIMAVSDRAQKATQGVFDPSIQPLWLATAQGRDLTAARKTGRLVTGAMVGNRGPARARHGAHLQWYRTGLCCRRYRRIPLRQRLSECSGRYGRGHGSRPIKALTLGGLALLGPNGDSACRSLAAKPGIGDLIPARHGYRGGCAAYPKSQTARLRFGTPSPFPPLRPRWPMRYQPPFA